MTLSLLMLAACTSSLPESGEDTDLVTDSAADTDAGATFSLRVVGFNVEGKDADVDTLSATIGDVTDEVIWGFSEVPSSSWAVSLRDAAKDDVEIWNHIYGGSGYEQRLALAWNSDVLELIGSEELEDINVGGTARAPLVGTFEHKATGVRFKAMVNHLWRSDDAKRHQQGGLLNEWAADQSMPLIAIGDYNFDWDIDSGSHDKGYDNMTASGVWEWAKPDPMSATHCFGSVLDFTFVANDAQDWDADGKVLADYEGYCPDSDRRSDHRPVQTTFTVPVPE